MSANMCTERYINPFTDFGFKLLFGTPANKEFLIAILNSLLDCEHPIVDIAYNNTEVFGKAPDDRKAVYDLYCETSDGSHIIVEMQNAYQRYFIDRTIYYTSFPIQASARRGDWDYRLPRIYSVAFLNFCMDRYADSPSYKHVVRQADIETMQVFYDKLTYIYLEMPKFNKAVDDLGSHADYWLYIIKNLAMLNEKPAELRDKVFERFFRTAEIARFSPEERSAYEASLKNMRDYKNTLSSAEHRGRVEGHAEGLAEGLAEGHAKGKAEGLSEGSKIKAVEVAYKMKEMGMPTEEIAKITSLSISEINAL